MTKDQQIIQLQNNIAYYSYIVKLTNTQIAGWKIELRKLMPEETSRLPKFPASYSDPQPDSHWNIEESTK